MLFSDNWAYIHIPKTSGTNFKNRAKLAVKTYEPIFENLTTQHNPFWYFEDLCKNKWTFTIVREPFERAISFWKHIAFKKHVIENFGFYELYDFYNLDLDFGNIYTSTCTTQVEFITGKQGKVNNIFKIEKDLLRLQETLGFTFTDTKHNSAEPYNYRDYYTPKTVDLIRKIFYDDFEYFGYNKDF